MARIVGVVTRPRETFAGFVADPRWAGALSLSTAAAAVASALFYSTEVGRTALVDQWERTAFASGIDLDDARYAVLVELSEYGAFYGAVRAIVSVAGVSVAVTAAAFLLLGRRVGRPAIRQALAVTAHASVILSLRLVIAAPIGYATERASAATSLADWMPAVEQGSSASRVLGMVDLLVLWWAVVAAVGIAVVYARPVRRVVPVFVGAYVGIALMLGGVAAVLGAG